MTKPATALAKILATLAETTQTTETRADAALALVRDAGIRTEEDFTAAVREAYTLNGWNARTGPSDGTLKAVPATVKQYMSQIRAAIRYGVAVGRVKSFYELRKALREKRAVNRGKVSPAMVGLRLIRAGEIIGAPFHDITAIYENLDKPKQRALLGDVESLVRKYKVAVNEEMRAA